LKIEFCVVSLFYQVISIWLSHPCQQQQNIVVNFHQDFIASKHRTSFRDRQIGAYSMGLNIDGKLGWPKKMSKKILF
jgi:hypothetical protein